MVAYDPADAGVGRCLIAEVDSDKARRRLESLELFGDVERITSWIELARTHVTRQGLPARIGWLGHGERTRLGLAVNEAVAADRLHAPVAFTRDHMDGAAMTHPHEIDADALLATVSAIGAPGVKEPSVYPEVEAMPGKPLAEYALA